MNASPLKFSPPCGPVEGRRDGPVIRVTGIPYASATRFGMPEAVPVWPTAPASSGWSASCPQPPTPDEFALLGRPTRALQTDENCLNLSVTLPADLRPDERLPVLVWIHGGSYLAGAGDDEFNDPVRLVAEQRIVAVSVTYRLGVFGYLAGAGRPAHLGLWDQLAALRWVRANISAFGGDPGELTLGGQSAGADAVVRILLTEEGGASVRRAIIQSAPLGIMCGRARLNAALDAGIGVIPAAATTTEMLAVGEAVAAIGARFGLRGQMPFSPRLGEDPLPAEDRIGARWHRTASHVDILLGHTRHETSFFIPSLPIVARMANLPAVGRIIEAVFVAVTTEGLYGRGTRRLAATHARAGGSITRYLFTWSAPRNRFRASHAVDLALLFGTRPHPDDRADDVPLLRGATSQQREYAGTALRSIWGAFIRGEQTHPQFQPGILTIQRRHRPPRRGRHMTPA